MNHETHIVPRGTNGAAEQTALLHWKKKRRTWTEQLFWFRFPLQLINYRLYLHEEKANIGIWWLYQIISRNDGEVVNLRHQ